MTVDPVDGTMNIAMALKPDTKVRVYQVAGKKATSRVVVDFYTK
jgi:hypothetical protein